MPAFSIQYPETSLYAFGDDKTFPELVAEFRRDNDPALIIDWMAEITLEQEFLPLITTKLRKTDTNHHKNHFTLHFHFLQGQI